MKKPGLIGTPAQSSNYFFFFFAAFLTFFTAFFTAFFTVFFFAAISHLLLLIRSVARGRVTATTHIKRGEPGLHRTPARTN